MLPLQQKVISDMAADVGMKLSNDVFLEVHAALELVKKNDCTLKSLWTLSYVEK